MTDRKYTGYAVVRDAPSLFGYRGVVMGCFGGRWYPLIETGRVRCGARGITAEQYIGWAVTKADALTLESGSDSRPAAGTRVIGFTDGGVTIRGYAFYEEYTRPNEVCVRESLGYDGGGWYATSWLVLPDDAETALVPHGGKCPDLGTLTIDTVNNDATGALKMSAINGLDDKTKEALARQAIDVANELGYCGETKRVLEKMGLPTTFKGRRKVTVEIEVEGTESDLENILSVERLALTKTLGGNELSTRLKIVKVTDKTEKPLLF